MANLGQILKQLQGERSRTKKELSRLDDAIAAVRKLVGTNSSGVVPRKSRARRRRSAAARRGMARAQRARWAKVRQQAAKG